MPLLTATEIADMRAVQSDTLPDTVVIWRYTSASDSMGGQTETWTAAGTTNGRMSVAGGGREDLIAERLTAADVWVVTVPQGTVVYERDRLVVGSRTVEVETVGEHAAWETARRCYGYEVTG